MADATWRTIAGDMLDYICWKHYKDSSGYVEAVLEDKRNYRLSDKPELLPADIIITLPRMEIKKAIVRLWDEPT